MVPDNELLEIINAILAAESFLSQGLLKESELEEIENRASQAYESTADHNSIQYRKYDRDRREHTSWKAVSISGYANPHNGAKLRRLKQQITELLNLHEVEVQPDEVFLPAGSPFKGRVVIRNILSTSTATIDIKDDYLFSANAGSKNIELLMILDPYLGTSLNLNVRMLGASGQLPGAVISDVHTFTDQYPLISIKGYSGPEGSKRESHDRFIIIDKKDVYKIGASAKDFGYAQTNIDKVNDPDIAQEYIDQFEQWWTKASPYKGIDT